MASTPKKRRFRLRLRPVRSPGSRPADTQKKTGAAAPWAALNASGSAGRLRPGTATGGAAPAPESQPEAPPVPAPAEDGQLSLAKPSAAEQRPMRSQTTTETRMGNDYDTMTSDDTRARPTPCNLPSTSVKPRSPPISATGRPPTAPQARRSRRWTTPTTRPATKVARPRSRTCTRGLRRSQTLGGRIQVHSG